MRQERIKEVLEQHRRRGLSLLTPESTASGLSARLLQSGGNHGLIEEIKAEARRMLSESDPELTYSLFRVYGETGERLTYERVYFERRKRLNAFAIMTLLEPNENGYSEALHNTVWSICNEYTWCLPAHFNAGAEKTEIDLFAAETGFALSEVLLLTEGALPDLLRNRIVEEVERRLLHPFLEEGPYGWEKADHNWAAVCAGSIGAASIHLIEDAGRLSQVLERVMAALDCYLSGFGDDGACAEGYYYWQYGFGYYVYFAQLLKAATQGKLDLFTSVKVKEIACFQQKCFTDGNTVVNFSDSTAAGSLFMGLSRCLQDEYTEVIKPDERLRAAYAADHCGRWAPAIRNLLWQREDGDGASERRPAWPAAAYYLPDVQWLLSRYTSESGGSYSFAAKGGHNDEPHNHNDVGHFLIHADGEAYLADLGSGMYTSQYFGPERYALWCNGSQGHSVPVIDGAHQCAGKQYLAAVKEVVTDKRHDLFVLDISLAYPPGRLDKLERRLRWSKEEMPYLTLLDTFSFTDDRVETEAAAAPKIGATSVTERFITFLKPVLAKEGRLILRGKRQLSIYYDYLVWEPVVTARSDIDHYGQERFWYTVDFKAMAENVNSIAGHFIFQFEA